LQRFVFFAPSLERLSTDAKLLCYADDGMALRCEPFYCYGSLLRWMFAR
jgi:hypothetical protein